MPRECFRELVKVRSMSYTFGAGLLLCVGSVMLIA